MKNQKSNKNDFVLESVQDFVGHVFAFHVVFQAGKMWLTLVQIASALSENIEEVNDTFILNTYFLILIKLPW